MLETVASQDLRIWHAYFGVIGSNNDINVLDASPMFDKVKLGTTLDTPLPLRGTAYKYRYYIFDGIYLEWATLAKAYQTPMSDKRIIFT